MCTRGHEQGFCGNSACSGIFVLLCWCQPNSLFAASGRDAVNLQHFECSRGQQTSVEATQLLDNYLRSPPLALLCNGWTFVWDLFSLAGINVQLFKSPSLPWENVGLRSR